MANQYNYSIELKPYGDKPGVVKIDPAALYGYFEFPDGSEGGGLWFDRDANGKLDLVDYDGVYELPKKVVQALRDYGVYVEPLVAGEEEV